MTRSPIALASGARTGVKPCREGAESSDHCTDDPDDPAPTCAGNNLTLPSGVADQRAVEARADVLLYTSEALDLPLEVTGPIRVTPWAAPSAVDTDSTAKLVDVHPNGYAASQAHAG